jgi:hypothetical protein
VPPVPDVLRSVIAPATCVAARCPSLYTYDDPLSGNRYMGCAHSVLATEIDVALRGGVRALDLRQGLDAA